MLHQVVISRGLAQDDRWEYESALAGLCVAHGLSALLVPHLYHLRETSPVWPRLAAMQSRQDACATILATWLYPRSAQWLLQNHQIDPAPPHVLCLSDYPSPDSALSHILSISSIQPIPSISSIPSLEELTDAPNERWYPILDRALCSDCGQCHQFCLFGVYGRDAAGRVVVENPDLCKPGCPACARLCPDGAILFPLYPDDAAIAGAPGCVATPDPAAREMLRRRALAAEAMLKDNGRGEEPKRDIPEIIRDDLDALLDELDKL